MDVDAFLEARRVVVVEVGMLLGPAMMTNAYNRVRKKLEDIY